MLFRSPRRPMVQAVPWQAGTTVPPRPGEFLTRVVFDAPPADVQVQATSAYALWRSNPRHGSLRFKKVEDSIPLYSARVGLHYRAVGKLEKREDGDTIMWFWIGSHGDYDRLLR